MSQHTDAPAAGDMTLDVDLLPLIRKGNEEAFRLIYNRHFTSVALIARRFLGSKELSEDAVQATFILLWEKSKHIELADTSLMPWLATVCRLHCRNIQKKEWKRTHSSIDDFPHLRHGSRAMEDQVIDAALVASLSTEIAGMSTTDQEIFHLCLIEGLRYEDAAERLGITRSALSNRLSRLKSKLRALLNSAA